MACRPRVVTDRVGVKAFADIFLECGGLTPLSTSPEQPSPNYKAASSRRLQEPDMNSAKWRKITELFDAALDRSADDRMSFLDAACEGDEEIRRRVEEMLAADARENLLIDRPAYKA